MSEQRPPETEGHQLISRRRFLALTGGGAVTAMVAGLILENDQSSNRQRRVEAAAALTRNNAAELTRQFEANAKTNSYASVWPGIAIIPRSVALMTTPYASAHDVIKWPKADQAKHLIAQRPFMVLDTVGQQNDIDGISSQTMGFWLPQSNQLAYLDFGRYSHQIVLATNSSAKIYSSDYQQIAGEGVGLQPAETHGGLIWRYLKTQRVLDQPCPSFLNPSDCAIELTKVVGRSMWANQQQAVAIEQAFATGMGNDPIQLPE